MVQDETTQLLVRRMERTLRSIKHPFYFEQDTIFGPDTAIEKWLGGGGNEPKLKNEMRVALAYCDSVGFRFVQLGSVSLAIVIYAEKLSNEETIGRSVVIESGVNPFTKFDMRKTWAFPFHANIFYIFSSSERAFSFRNVAQDKCKHHKFGVLRTIHVKPWCIDFQGKHVTAPKAILGGLDKEPPEIESNLFSGA